MEKDITGIKFNKLTAIRKGKSIRRNNSSSTITYWLFKCAKRFRINFITN